MCCALCTHTVYHREPNPNRIWFGAFRAHAFICAETKSIFLVWIWFSISTAWCAHQIRNAWLLQMSIPFKTKPPLSHVGDGKKWEKQKKWTWHRFVWTRFRFRCVRACARETSLTSRTHTFAYLQQGRYTKKSRRHNNNIHSVSHIKIPMHHNQNNKDAPKIWWKSKQQHRAATHQECVLTLYGFLLILLASSMLNGNVCVSFLVLLQKNRNSRLAFNFVEASNGTRPSLYLNGLLSSATRMLFNHRVKTTFYQSFQFIRFQLKIVFTATTTTAKITLCITSK